MLVVRGLPKVYKDGHLTQETIDQGKPRGAGDVLTLSRGIDNGNLKASLIRGVINICANRDSRKVSVGLIGEVLDLYQEEVEAVIHHKFTVMGLVFAPALSAFVFAAKAYKDEVLLFEQLYFSGEHLVHGNPILTFRNFMLQRNSAHGGMVYRQVVRNHALNALMHHVLNTKLKRLVNNPAGRDFFANKQKKMVTQIEEMLRY